MCFLLFVRSWPTLHQTSSTGLYLNMFGDKLASTSRLPLAKYASAPCSTLHLVVFADGRRAV
jgi:hypothetical protein